MSRRGRGDGGGWTSWPSGGGLGDRAGRRSREATGHPDPASLGEEAAAAEEHDHGPRVEVGRDQVEQRRKAEEEGEAPDGADTEQVERARREDRHQVGSQDRAVRPLEAAVDRRTDGLAAAYLVFESFEVDDV